MEPCLNVPVPRLRLAEPRQNQGFARFCHFSAARRIFAGFWPVQKRFPGRWSAVGKKQPTKGKNYGQPSYLYVYGTLADTNNTFDVYLYDDYGNLLVYATGLSAPNGQIAIGWDLTDGHGNQISFGNVQAVFYLHPPGGSGGVQPDDASPSPVFSTWFLKDIANAGGAFAVAWGWNSYGSQFNNNESLLSRLAFDDSDFTIVKTG
jgi:hypothetical protein